MMHEWELYTINKRESQHLRRRLTTSRTWRWTEKNSSKAYNISKEISFFSEHSQKHIKWKSSFFFFCLFICISSGFSMCECNGTYQTARWSKKWTAKSSEEFIFIAMCKISFFLNVLLEDSRRYSFYNNWFWKIWIVFRLLQMIMLYSCSFWHCFEDLGKKIFFWCFLWSLQLKVYMT